jgi:hypothetical protein
MKKYPKFMHIREPYGTLHLVDCVVEKDDYFGNFTIEGTVKEGVTRSFMCGFTHTRNEKGERHFVYNVSKQELKQGYKRDIAM